MPVFTAVYVEIKDKSQYFPDWRDDASEWLVSIMKEALA